MDLPSQRQLFLSKPITHCTHAASQHPSCLWTRQSGLCKPRSSIYGLLITCLVITLLVMRQAHTGSLASRVTSSHRCPVTADASSIMESRVGSVPWHEAVVFAWCNFPNVQQEDQTSYQNQTSKLFWLIVWGTHSWKRDKLVLKMKLWIQGCRRRHTHKHTRTRASLSCSVSQINQTCLQRENSSTNACVRHLCCVLAHLWAISVFLRRNPDRQDIHGGFWLFFDSCDVFNTVNKLILTFKLIACCCRSSSKSQIFLL